MTELRDKLRALLAALTESGDAELAQEVAGALERADDELAAYLTSDALWGSKGSLCDRAFQTEDATIRRKGTKAIIALGKQQIAWGVRDGRDLLHERTRTWTSALSDWLREGVI